MDEVCLEPTSQSKLNISTILNPILYSITGKQFRKQLRHVCTFLCYRISRNTSRTHSISTVNLEMRTTDRISHRRLSCPRLDRYSSVRSSHHTSSFTALIRYAAYRLHLTYLIKKCARQSRLQSARVNQKKSFLRKRASHSSCKLSQAEFLRRPFSPGIYQKKFVNENLRLFLK